MNASRLPLPACLMRALALVAAIVLLPIHADAQAWGGEKLTGSGVTRTETRTVTGFRSIALGVGARVELHQGGSEGLTITGDDNIVQRVETVVEDGTLRIRWKGNANIAPSYKSLVIVVNAKNVDGLTIGGSGHIQAAHLKASRLRATIGGSGEITLDVLDAEALDVTIGGSGRMRAAGRAEALQVAVAGSGELSAARLETRRASIALQGSGQADVWAKETLNVTVAGSGDITYRGTPQVKRTVLGSGTVRQAKDAS